MVDLTHLTHKGTEEIETERLILRRFGMGDANEIFREWASYENVVKFLTWEKHASIAQTKTFLVDVIGGYARLDKYCWGIELKNEGMLIGSIDAKITDGRSRVAELGYCLGERFWNFGYATESVRAVSDYMFYDVNLNRLEAYHSVENPASGRVLIKAGLFREGHMRQKYMTADGAYQNSELYGLIKEDFAKQYEPEIKEFLNLDEIALSAYSISLKCTEYYPGNAKKNHVPGYNFDITDKSSGTVFGQISLRLGFTDGLYYGGHIGYSVDEQYRNVGVATAACHIILNLAKAHKFKKILITNNHQNKASRRVCEKIGAKLVRIAALPEGHDLYAKGQRLQCIYELLL